LLGVVERGGGDVDRLLLAGRGKEVDAGLAETVFNCSIAAGDRRRN
jgi:hypothetical protein